MLSGFNNMNWITKNWGLNCNIETGQTVKDYIRHAIQCTAKNAEQKNTYSHTDWTKINNNLVFLCNGLYLDENIEQSVELDGKLNRYCLIDVTQRNIDEDLKCIFKLIDKEFIPHKIILPLLAIAFLSPLNHFLKIADCEPRLVLFLIGKTGVKKSTLSSLVLSLFGDFTNTDLPISFKDTGNSIIEQTFILKDVLTVIDDFHPSNKLDEQNLNKNAQTIMRAYGDRIGRNRLRSDSTLMIAKPPRGNAIFTIKYSINPENKEELKSLLKQSIILLGITSVVMTICAEILAKLLASVFVSYDHNLLEMTTNAIRIFSLSFIISGFNIFASSFFTALNNGAVSAIISFVRTLVF